MNASLLPLAYLLPLGLLLVAWGSLPGARLRESALAALAIAVASAVAYVGFGFALQFGGVGLSASAPAGLRALDQAWSPFAAGAGRWTFLGLEGFFAGAQGAPDNLALVETLALHRLPLAIAAGLIAVAALGDHVNRIARMASGIVATAVVLPVAGAWIWGGGWLAALGLNLNLGHGAIDVGGSSIAFGSAGCVALAALRLFGSQRDQPNQAPALPALRQPLLALAGAILLGIGWIAWAASDPLLSDYARFDATGNAMIGLIGALASALVAGAYTWFATGRIRALMTVRGWLAGWIAVGASAWFIPPGSAIAVGAVAGSLSVIIHYAVAFKWGWDDHAGMVATCGGAGAWGMLALGIFADGAFGAGWNGVANGVRGALSSDPGQLTAQAFALAALAALVTCVAALLLFPLSLLLRLRK
jgi:Amt family ammonium transporter